MFACVESVLFVFGWVWEEWLICFCLWLILFQLILLRRKLLPFLQYVVQRLNLNMCECVTLCLLEWSIRLWFLLFLQFFLWLEWMFYLQVLPVILFVKANKAKFLRLWAFRGLLVLICLNVLRRRNSSRLSLRSFKLFISDLCPCSQLELWHLQALI